MKRFKSLVFVAIFTLMMPHHFFGQVAQVKKQEPFRARGVVTQVDPAAKTFFLKNEGGLELTYFVDDSTDFEGSEFLNLATGSNVEVTYRYNENYEKIALTVQDIPEQAKPSPSKS